MALEAPPVPVQNLTHIPKPEPQTDPAKMTTAERIKHVMAQKTVEDAENPNIKAEIPAKPQAKADETKKPASPADLFKKKDAPVKVDDKPDEFETPKDFKDPARASQWDALKASRNEFKTKYETEAKEKADLAAKLTAAEERAKKAGEYETQLSERDQKLKEQDEFVRLARVESHPDFQKQMNRRKELIAKATKTFEENGADAATAERALHLTGKNRADALKDLAADLNAVDASRIGRILEEVETIDGEADAARAKSQEWLKDREARDAEQQRAQKQNNSASMKRVFEDVFSEEKGDAEMLTEIDGNEDWNKGITEIVSDARKVWESNDDPRVSARDTLQAAMYRRGRGLITDTLTELDSTKAELAEAKKELEGIYSKGPNVRPGGGGNANADVKKMGVVERMRHEGAFDR